MEAEVRGNVGTGFDDKLLKSIYEQLQPLRIGHPSRKKSKHHHLIVGETEIGGECSLHRENFGWTTAPSRISGLRPDKFAHSNREEEVSPPDSAETEKYAE